jgi:hypothetical protein
VGQLPVYTLLQTDTINAAIAFTSQDELRNKGYAYDEDEAEADNPHQTLIGALRVEVRAACCASQQQPQAPHRPA